MWISLVQCMIPQSRLDGILMTWSTQSFIGLGWNVVGLVTITVWTGFTCLVMFYILKRLNMLRVDTDLEFKGNYIYRTYWGSNLFRRFYKMVS